MKAKVLEKMQERYEKELSIVNEHQKKAEEMKEKIDAYTQNMAKDSITKLRLSASEYEKLLVLLSSGKANILAAAEIVTGKENEKTEEREMAKKTKSDVTDPAGEEDQR